VTGTQAVVRWQASQDSVVGKWPPGSALARPPVLWQVVQLPGATPTCENRVPGTGVVDPDGAPAVTPEVGAVVEVAPAGLPIGLTAATVGLGLALAAAAAKAAPVALWQSMQSAAAVLPWWAPIVAVLKVAFCHRVPLGAWQVTHFGADEPEPLVPLPLV
jgi:hypothetical protein